MDAGRKACGDWSRFSGRQTSGLFTHGRVVSTRRAWRNVDFESAGETGGGGDFVPAGEGTEYEYKMDVHYPEDRGCRSYSAYISSTV